MSYRFGPRRSLLRSPTVVAAASALKTGLVSFWELDDVNDAHGTNTMTNNGSATFTTGKVGNGVLCSQTGNKRLQLADNVTLDFTGDFSIAFWASFGGSKPASTAGIVAKYDGADSEFRIFYSGSSDDRFYFTIYDSAETGNQLQASNFGSPSVSTFYFFVAMCDADGNISINVNNGTANTMAKTKTITHAAAPFYIGADAPTEEWEGIIDQVGYWTRLLTADEQTQLYNGGSGLAYSAM